MYDMNARVSYVTKPDDSKKDSQVFRENVHVHITREIL